MLIAPSNCVKSSRLDGAMASMPPAVVPPAGRDGSVRMKVSVRGEVRVAVRGVDEGRRHHLGKYHFCKASCTPYNSANCQSH